MPSKPKWTRRKTYQRIRNEIQALEVKAKTRRFKKPLSTPSSTLLTLIVIPAIYAVAKGIAIRSPRLAPSLQQT